MLSIDNVSLSKGRSYYEKENYYSKESAKEFSEWQGKLSEDLGLNGKVDFETFDKLLFGYNKEGKSIATNSVEPKRYKEAEISNKERGNLEFTIAKVCEIYPFKENEYKKISDIIKYHTRHNKKITIGDKETCLSQIKKVIKKTEVSANDKTTTYKTIETAITKITRPKERRAGYDLTFSAPKSASIMALVHKDQDVLQAHRDAVMKTLDYIEAKYANTRIGDNLNREIENTKKLLIAKFEHNTSRENDPQLHTHCVVLNLIQREDGEWRSLHADEFRNNSKLFGAIYQNEFANRMYELGYNISSDKNGTFKITNVPDELTQCFSKRRKQMIEEGVTDQKSARKLVYVNRAKKSENIDPEEQHKYWLKETKQTGTDLSKIRGSERVKAAFDKTELISSIHDSFAEASKMKMAFKYEEAYQHFVINNHGKYQVTSKEIIELFDKEAQRELIQLENKMFITKQALEMETRTKEILEKTSSVQSIVNTSKEEIENLIKNKSIFTKKNKESIIQDIIDKTNQIPLEVSLHLQEIAKYYLHEDKRISFEENKEISDLVSEIIRDLKLKKEEKKELKADLNLAFGKATELTEGQKNAIVETLTSREKHIAWLGVAGAGKTFSLATVVEQAKLAGFHVEGFAQNKKAATILSKETGMEVNTIAKLLLAGTQDTNKEKIWIVDEAGMIGTKLGHDFVVAAKEANARLIIVGDNRQLSSPTAGHFLKLVANYTNLKKMYLNQSLRQKDDDLSKGVQILNSIQFERLGSQTYKKQANELIEEALKHFKNSVIELKTEEARISHIVNEYLSLDIKEREKTLVVARTHKAISEITTGIRERLKEAGYLTNEMIVPVYSAVDLNDKKAKYALNYESGDYLIFEKDSKIFDGKAIFEAKAKEEYKIIDSDIVTNLITISDKHGRKFKFDPKITSYKEVNNKNINSCLPVYKKSELKICENDRLCWNRNIWQSNRVNKQEFKVLKIDHENQFMKIKYDNGKELDVDLKQMNFMQHAWAVTYNAAQGDTKKNTIGIVDGFSSLEDIYTLFTRPTHKLKVYVESEEFLKKSMLKSGSKKTAMELVHEKKENKILMTSNKMDFYDRYQKMITFEKDQTILSFSAPSDISSLLFTKNEEQQIKIIQAHEMAIQNTLEKFKQMTGFELHYHSETEKTIFNDSNKPFSKIQYLNSNLKIQGIKSKENSILPLNKFVLIEHQGIIKNLYQNYLCDQLNSIGIETFNVNGIIRTKERNDHIHAVFSEHFEKNMKLLEKEFKVKQFDKFASTYEIQKYSTLSKESQNNKNVLNWDIIKKDVLNENEKDYLKKDKENIIRDSIITLCKDLQVFDEKKLYEVLLSETKGNLSINEVNELHAKILLHQDIRFIAHDKFGKMVFAHKDLNYDEANVLQHATTRKEDNNHILSFERVIRRAEKKGFTEQQTAAFAHCTIDLGAVKFLSGLKDEEVKPILNETKSLYENSGFKVLGVYAGSQSATKLNTSSDFHLGYLLNKIREKKVKLDKDTVLILKDIGNNITKNMTELFDLAKKHDSKIIFQANENDFKEGEKRIFLKNLKNLAGLNFNTRYKGILKQKDFYDKNSQIKKQNFHKSSINTSKIEENKKGITEAEKQRLSNIMNDVQKFYSNNLFSEQGKEAREYLNKRGFTNEQIVEFGFGLSFANGIEDFAKSKGYSKKDLIDLSLLTEKKEGNSYDFYRHRIMIPIKDNESNYIGFGGRVYRQNEIEKGIAKYINPRNTVLFDKRNTLFNLDAAKHSIKEKGEVIVVEGYMDALAMRKYGIDNVVAVMGTSLSKENVNQLKAHTKEITLLFDNDKAGKEAVKNSYTQAVGSSLKLSFASVNDLKDPDEFLKNFGATKFKNEVLNKKLPLDYIVNSSYNNLEKDKYLEIIKWRKEILPHIMQIQDSMQRNLELKGASLAMGVPLTRLLDEKKNYFIPTAFLTQEEIQERKDSFLKTKEYNNNINKNKKFDNTLSSNLSMQNVLQNEELNKGIIFEIEKLGLNTQHKEDISKFILENQNLLSCIKEDIKYNESIIFTRIQLNKDESNHILNIYRHLKENYPDMAPQQISERLFEEEMKKEQKNNLSSQKNPEIYYYNKLLNKIDKGSLSEELKFMKEENQFERSLQAKAYQFVFQQIQSLNKNEFQNKNNDKILLDSHITLEKFNAFLQEKRLHEVIMKQEELQLKTKLMLTKEIEKNSELTTKFNSLTFSEKETIYTNILPNKIDKNISKNENLDIVNKYYHNINENKQDKEPFIKNTIVLIENKIDDILETNKNNSIKKEFEKLSLTIENNNLKEQIKEFEVRLKEDISYKLSDKKNISEVFEETRKILIQESKFIDRQEKNPYTSYLNLAKEENIQKFSDILKDLDIKKIEGKFQSEKKGITVEKKDIVNKEENIKDNLTRNIIQNVFKRENIKLDKEEMRENYFNQIANSAGLKNHFSEQISSKDYSQNIWNNHKPFEHSQFRFDDPHGISKEIETFKQNSNKFEKEISKKEKSKQKSISMNI